MALRQHSNEVMVEVLTIARQEMPADGEARPSNEVHKRQHKATSDMQHLPWSGWGNNKCPARATYAAVVLQAFVRT